MAEPYHQHLVAANGSHLEGWSYPESATKAALDLITGRAGELRVTSDTGQIYYWNGASNQWLALDVPQVATGTFTGDNATTVFPINHNLGRRTVQITLRHTTTQEIHPPGGPAISSIDLSDAQVTFTIAPTNIDTYEWVAE